MNEGGRGSDGWVGRRSTATSRTVVARVDMSVKGGSVTILRAVDANGVALTDAAQEQAFDLICTEVFGSVSRDERSGIQQETEGQVNFVIDDTGAVSSAFLRDPPGRSAASRSRDEHEAARLMAALRLLQEAS